MSFTAVYRTVLQPFVETYGQAKNEKGRKNVVDDAAAAVKKAKSLLEDAAELPQELHTVRLSTFLPLSQLIAKPSFRPSGVISKDF